MEEKKCAMCGQVKKLCESHIIPKFFGNYIKKNSPSGALRNPNNVNKRDTKKTYFVKIVKKFLVNLKPIFKKYIFKSLGYILMMKRSYYE